MTRVELQQLKQARSAMIYTEYAWRILSKANRLALESALSTLTDVIGDNESLGSKQEPDRLVGNKERI